MNKEKYNQIIDAVYEIYINKLNYNEKDCHVDDLINKPNKTFVPYNQEEFINKFKTDQEFSERWGLKIEERELSWEERVQWVMKNTDVEWENLYIVEEINKESSPTKLITLTYNEEKIEVYE
jgi:hypothetical protein